MVYGYKLDKIILYAIIQPQEKGGVYMTYKNHKPQAKMVRFAEGRVVIPNIYDLEKIGAGHDGAVFRYGELALKLLKYELLERKEKNLMTFDKVNHLCENVSCKRIIMPTDILLDEDGVYTGYVMPYIDNVASEKKKGTEEYKAPGDFELIQLIYAMAYLEEDFEELINNRVRAKDINRGSYIYNEEFLHLCDTDKYIIADDSSKVADLNYNMMNFSIAKFLVYEMQKSEYYNKAYKNELSKWVRKVCGDRNFFKELNQDFGNDLNIPIKEYTDYKVKQIINR